MSLTESFCAWHVIVLDGTVDDPEITVMHPGCAFTVAVHRDTHFTYMCEIQSEIDNVGFDSLLDGLRDKPGWYRTRMRHYTVRSSAGWSEIDCEIETEPLVVARVGTP